MSTSVWFCHSVTLMGWMGLDLPCDPIIIIIKNNKGKYAYMIPTEGLSQRSLDARKL